MMFNLFYRSYVEAFVQEVTFPLTEQLSADFETKLTAEYKVVIGLQFSDSLTKVRSQSVGGDGYESSKNLGKSVLEGVKLKVVGLTNSNINFKETFSIFGGAPAYENTALGWDPHASYLLANFQGKAGNQYRLTIIQKTSKNSQSKPQVPAYIMVRKASNWTSFIIPSIVSLCILTLLIATLFKIGCYIFRIIRGLFRTCRAD